MKKFLLSFSLALCVTGNTFAISNLTAKTDYASEKIIIEGVTEAENTKVAVFVLNPGKTFSDIEADGAVQNVRKITAEKNKFSYSFKIHEPETNTGWITCYVKETDGEYSQVSTYVASKSEIDAMINDILTNGTADKLENDIFVNVFEVVNSEIYKKTEKNALSVIADAYLNGFVRTELEADRKAVAKLIKQASITEAYNQKIDAAYITEEGTLTDEAVYEIDKKDEELGTNVLEIFNTILSDEGKEKVITSLKGNKFDDFAKLQKMFMEKTMLYGLNNAKELGYSQVSEILTAKNKEFLGISENVSDTELQKKISSADDDFETPDDLKTFISNYNKNNGGSSGSGSSSGSGGGSGGSFGGSIGGIGGASFATGSSAQPDAEKESFSDISGASWAKDAIESLYKKEIINGKEDGRFYPDGYITREEFTKIIAKAFHYEYSNYTVPFEDVDMNMWYAPYVSAAFEKGIINGLDETRFGTGEYISREDLCVIIYRILGNEGFAEKAQFTDYDAVSDYAKEAVDYMTEKGILSGFEDGSFRPARSCTRAEAAKIIYGILEGI